MAEISDDIRDFKKKHAFFFQMSVFKQMALVLLILLILIGLFFGGYAFGGAFVFFSIILIAVFIGEKITKHTIKQNTKK